MRIVIIVLFIAGLAAAGFWYITENSRADRELAYQRQQKQLAKVEAMEKERAERQREEDERIRKERAANVAKEDAMRMFLSYIDREEERLKDKAEEAEIAIQKIEIDQTSFEEEIKAIERANEARVNSNKKRGESQRDNIERVRAMLKSVVLNRLSREYIGEDLSSLRDEFEAEMQKTRDVDDRYLKRYKENLRKYDETVKGVDEKLDKQMKSLRTEYDAVKNKQEMSKASIITKLKEELAHVKKEIEKQTGKKASSHNWEKNARQNRRLNDLRQKEMLIESQIAQHENLEGLTAADILHMKVTEAESSARRIYDHAGISLRMDDIAAQRERDHEQDVYNRVREFRGRSLDRIQAAMNARYNAHAETLKNAKQQLSHIRGKAVNLDFLTAEEIEAMRKEIAKSISKSIIEVEVSK